MLIPLIRVVLLLLLIVHGWLCPGRAEAGPLTGDAWTWPAAALTVRGFTDVTMKGSEYWAVSEGGVFKSTNLTTWTQVSVTGLTDVLISIRWTGSRFVASGVGMWTSTDGVAWTFRASFYPVVTLGLAVKGSTVIAAGILGTVLRSADGGLTWSGISLGDSVNFSGATATSSHFVIVGQGGVIARSPDGLTWTQINSDTVATLTDVTVAGSRLVAVGENAVVTTSSDNGATWDAYYIAGGEGITFYGVAGDSNNTVICGPRGLMVATTKPQDPTKIQIVNIPGAQSLHYAVVRGGSGWACVGAGGSVLTSTNATTWTARAPLMSYNFMAVTRTSSHFVASGFPGDRFLRSTDGVTWGAVASPLPASDVNALSAMVWSATPAKLVVGATDGRIFSGTAADGTGLTLRNSGTTQRISGGCWTGSQFIMTCAGGRILTSVDGDLWVARNSGHTESLNVAATNGTRHVVAGHGFNPTSTYGVILTSTDGITWGDAAVPERGILGLAWNGSLFVAVGWDGLILTSPDGLAWTRRYASLDGDDYGRILTSVAWAGTNWVACDNEGSALLSTDGVNWLVRPFAGSIPVNAMVYGAGKLIAAGEAGEILASVAVPASLPKVRIAPFSRTVDDLSSLVLGTVVEGTPALHYQWRKDGAALPGENKPVIALPGVEADDSGAYDVIVTNDAGSATTPAAAVRVKAPPMITVPATPQVFTEGTTATITCSVAGAAPYTYRWIKSGGGVIAGQTSPTLTLPAVTLAASGFYYAEVTNEYGTGASALVPLEVVPTLVNALDLPAGTTITTGGAAPWRGIIETNGNDAAQCSGGSAPGESGWLEISVTDKIGVSFDWSFSPASDGDRFEVLVDGVPVGELYGNSNQTNILPTGPGTHTVRWRYTEAPVIRDDPAQSVRLDHLVLLSSPMAPVLGLPLYSQWVEEGTGTEFRVYAAGSGPLSYQWHKNNVPIPGANTAVLTFPSVARSDIGSYTVTVTNAQGSFSTAPQLAVRPTLRNALDLPPWITSLEAGATGNGTPWQGRPLTAFDPVNDFDMAESGYTVPGGDSWLQISVSGVSRVAYTWSLSGFSLTELSFTIDGVTQRTLTTATAGTENFALTPQGTHVLRWTSRFVGPGVGSFGRSTLDAVQFTPDAASDLPVWAAELNLPTDRRSPASRNGPLLVENTLAYALGIDSLTATPANLPSLVMGNDSVTLKYTRTRRASGITYEVQRASSPAGPWSSAGVVDQLESTTSSQEIRNAIYTPFTGTPRVFMRLKVTFTGG